MDETRERIRAWNSRPVGELARLAEREFTGALVAGDDVLFLLNGRAVGSTGPSPEAFADGEAHEAPGPALPLLFAMFENGGETKSRGYTNDTPLREVDETLQSSKFTGYVELSENVLSGDYYLVYYGGRALYVAFVGNETITGRDAFERADDEVGIYEVVAASVDVADLPTGDEPSDDGNTEGSDGTATAAAGATAAEAADSPEESAEPADAGTADSDGAGESARGAGAAPADEPVSDAPAEEGDDDTAEPNDRVEPEPVRMEPAEGTDASSEASEPDPGNEPEPETGGGADRAGRTSHPEPASESREVDEQTSETVDSVREGDEPVRDDDGPAREPSTPEVESEAADAPADAVEPTTGGPEPDARTDPAEDRGGEASPAAPEADSGSEGGEASDASAGEPDANQPTDPAKARPTRPDGTVFDAEEEWRETTSIPALDPDEAEEADPNTEEPERGRTESPHPEGQQSEPEQGEPQRGESRQAEPARENGALRETLRERTEALEKRTERLRAARERVETLEAELEETRAERDEFEATAAELERERDTLREERNNLREERDDLRERVEALETELEEARESEASEAAAGAALDARQALSETNLFVRYDSKSQPTLDAVRDGATPEEVRSNLRLDEHTAFDSEGATVDGEPFDAFLRSTPEYVFVQWAVTELPFEIRDTAHDAGLAELYAALPDVDRAELHGAVEIETEEGVESHEFDVVLRNRMGEPLIVADINAARDPVSGEMMEGLVESASAVASAEDIGAALYVTASFFEPGALETAESSTGGGLLSRSNKESYVRAGNGYHLCLVESRDDSFYVTVPEL